MAFNPRSIRSWSNAVRTSEHRNPRSRTCRSHALPLPRQPFSAHGPTLAASGLRVNQSRLWDSIHHTAQWGDSHDGGVRRLTLTQEDKAVRNWFLDTTAACGCTNTVDQMGNIFSTRPGKNSSLPPVAIGSHLDTQPAGGRYDGILGVLAGVEALKVLQENAYATYAPLAVVNWTNEEGARFNTGMLASGVWAGQVDQAYAEAHQDAQGKTFKDELQAIGFRGHAEASHRTNPLSAHFELHIEQGPVLEDEKKAVGVVNGVQGMGWLIVTVEGRCQHCGTTPMDRRSDALLAASLMIARVNEIAWEHGGMTTVGVIESTPQSPGTIPGWTRFSVDMCHLENPALDGMATTIQRELERLAGEGKVKVEVKQTWRSPGVTFDAGSVDCVRTAAVKAVGDNGYRVLPAGAGHDSVNTSYVCPTAMVFIPSKDGISHHPSEYSTPEDCAMGAQVLLDAVLEFDRRLEQRSSETT